MSLRETGSVTDLRLLYPFPEPRVPAPSSGSPSSMSPAAHYEGDKGHAPGYELLSGMKPRRRASPAASSGLMNEYWVLMFVYPTCS